MQCPECKRPLLALELNRVEIDYCAFCGGIWLDSDELEILAEMSGGQGDNPVKIIEAKDVGEADLRCPICSKRMLKVEYRPNSGLILDKCAGGDGFWLNKGELESVLSMAGSGSRDEVISLLNDIFDYRE